MVDAIYEVLALWSYVLGMEMGIFLANREIKQFMKKMFALCLMGIAFVYIGMVLYFFPLMYVGCFLTCIIVGSSLPDFLEDIYYSVKTLSHTPTQ